MLLKVSANTRLVERLHPQAKVIEVPGFLSRCCAASLAEFAIDGHQIDDGSTSAQLNETYLVLPSFDNASKRAAVEAKHAFRVDNAQHQVINFADVDHGGRAELANV